MEPIFLTNPLFFHFCAWLIFSKRDIFDIQNLNRACDSLRQFIVERIDFRQLDLEGITREYPTIDVEKAVRRNDEANLKFITGLVSECKRVEHLTVPSESDQWLLQAIKHLPQSVATVTLGRLPFCIPPSGISNTEINLVVADCTSETLKEVKNAIMESANTGRTFRVFLLDFYHHRKTLNITNLLGKIVKELHIVTEAAHLHFQGPLGSCRLLTHLSLFRMTTLAQFALINTLEDMRHLTHLTILSNSKVINVLPSCSNLTHLSLFYTKVSDTGLKELASLSSRLVSLCMTADNFLGDCSCARAFLGGNWQNLKKFTLISTSSDFYERYDIPFPRRQTKMTTDKKTNHISSAIDPRAMPSISSLSLINSVDSVADLSQKVAKWNICELDISHCSGITGNVSCLLHTCSPFLNSLILHDCGLNSQDLTSLAQANVEGKLPELRHLDVSENLGYDFRDLFAHGSEWHKLVSLIISLKECESQKWLAEKVELGCLSRLQKLRLWIFCPCNVKTVDVMWSHLEQFEVFLLNYDCNAKPIMARVANARGEGRLPALRTMSLMIDSPEQILYGGQGDVD